MGLEAILGLLTRFIQDPEQREKAIQAAREGYVKFIMATSSPLYSLLRTIIILGAILDVGLNQGMVWATAIDNLKARGPAGLLELGIIFWLFLGDKVVEPMAQAFGILVTKFFTADKPPTPTKPDKPAISDPPADRGGRFA